MLTVKQEKAFATLIKSLNRAAKAFDAIGILEEGQVGDEYLKRVELTDEIRKYLPSIEPQCQVARRTYAPGDEVRFAPPIILYRDPFRFLGLTMEHLAAATQTVMDETRAKKEGC